MNLRINHIAFVENYLTNVLDESVHAKRIRSLADATIGVITSVSLAVSIIGQSLAHAKRLTTKHAVKQVDRLLSNKKIVVWDMFEEWVKEVVGKGSPTSRIGPIFEVPHQGNQCLDLKGLHYRRVRGAARRRRFWGAAGRAGRGSCGR